MACWSCCWCGCDCRRRSVGCGTVRDGGERQCGDQRCLALEPDRRGDVGPYEGSADSLWSAYASARGRRRTLLGRLALKPRALFIGSWIANSRIRSVAEEIVQGTQQGDPDVMAQFGTFELNPWEGSWSGQGQWNVPASERGSRRGSAPRERW